MKNSKVLKTILLISGLIASAIGAAILFTPGAFYASYGIELGDNVSLLNEIRASGGALLASGLLIMSGAFVDKLAMHLLARGQGIAILASAFNDEAFIKQEVKILFEWLSQQTDDTT